MKWSVGVGLVPAQYSCTILPPLFRVLTNNPSQRNGLVGAGLAPAHAVAVGASVLHFYGIKTKYPQGFFMR